MKTIMLRWPSVLAVVCLALNVDFVIMPALSSFDITGWDLFWCATVAATAEVLYWYWYSGWLARYIKASGPPRRTARHFKEEGLLRKVKRLANKAIEVGEALRDWFVEHAVHQLELNTPWKKGLMDGAYDIIKHTHKLMMYPLMIGLGCVPVGWSVAIVLNRVQYVPLAFPLYLFVNAMKAWALGVLYLWMPLWAKLLLWAVLILLLVSQIRKFLPRKRARQDAEDVPFPGSEDQSSPE